MSLVDDVEQLAGKTPMQIVMEAQGIRGSTLAKLLKEGLRAKETKTIKVKGTVDPNKLPRGYRVVAVSGRIIYDVDGNPKAGDGETVLEYDLKHHDIRQRSRSDAHKLRGDYPPEQREVKLDLNRPLTPDEEALLKEAMAAKE